MINAQKLISDKCEGKSGFEPNVLKRKPTHGITTQEKSSNEPISAQIHHEGKNIWVLSYKLVGSQLICLIDSMRSTRATFSPSLKIQLAAVYDHTDNLLNINMPFIQQQRNRLTMVLGELHSW